MCFSIKPKEQEPTKEIKSALPVEESDEEEESKTISNASSGASKDSKASASLLTAHSTTVYAVGGIASQSIPAVGTSTIGGSIIPITGSTERNVILLEGKGVEKVEEIGDKKEVTEDGDVKNGIIDVDDPILEMIDLTDDLEERRDAKRGEDFFCCNYLPSLLEVAHYTVEP